ncbi:MAG: hypothetical protein RJA76_2124, partial [Bacteroidota bacterium]
MKRLIIIHGILIICLKTNLLLSQTSISQKWIGFINEKSSVYEYIIIIKSLKGEVISGTTISKSKDFYSETKFKGIVKGNEYLINETELLKTNYKGAGSVCLMKLNLKRKNDKLEGSFTSSNKEIKDCGSGTISLSLVKEKQAIPAPKEATKTVMPEQPSIKKEIEVIKPAENKNIEQPIASPTQINNQ